MWCGGEGVWWGSRPGSERGRGARWGDMRGTGVRASSHPGRAGGAGRERLNEVGADLRRGLKVSMVWGRAEECKRTGRL